MYWITFGVYKTTKHDNSIIAFENSSVVTLPIVSNSDQISLDISIWAMAICGLTLKWIIKVNVIKGAARFQKQVLRIDFANFLFHYQFNAILLVA